LQGVSRKKLRSVACDVAVVFSPQQARQLRAGEGRVWVYLGDAAHPYSVFDITLNRKRDGLELFLPAGGGGPRRFPSSEDRQTVPHWQLLKLLENAEGC
jgi:hypothetical protein